MSGVNHWPADKDGNWICMVCNEKMPEGYEPPTCCSGHECGCMGKPTEPNVCSEKCWNKLANYNNGVSNG